MTDVFLDPEDDDDPYLSDEEFERLSPEQQDRYLSLIRAELEGWELTPKQQEAEHWAHQVDELLFGGSAGGGKSDWLLYHAYELSKKYENHQTLIIRRSFPRLRRSLIRRSLQVFKPADDNCRWRPSDKEWRFSNGSVIEFGYCETEDDIAQYLSAQYDCILIDEATELSEYQWVMLRSRCRTNVTKRRAGIRPHVCGATNPGQQSHFFHKGRFVTPEVDASIDENGDLVCGPDAIGVLDVNTLESGVVLTSEVVKDIHGQVRKNPDGTPRVRKLAFVPALVSDNPHQDPDYIDTLMSLPEIEQRMYYLGDWDVFKGQFFTEWNRQIHVVQDFPVPPEWYRFMGWDHGFRDPACGGWFAVDPDGFIVLYRELWETDKNIDQLAELALHLEAGEKIHYRKADPSIFRNVGGKGGSTNAQYRDSGLLFSPANNDRSAGWSRVRQFLRIRQGVQPPAWARLPPEYNASPGLFVMASCTNVIRGMGAMIHDENKPEDMAKHRDDHGPDMVRYALMSRPQPATEHAKPDESRAARVARKMRELRDRKPGGGILGDP